MTLLERPPAAHAVGHQFGRLVARASVEAETESKTDEWTTLSGKGTQDEFWIPIKIPAEYVSLMPKLPENAKSKKICKGTYFTL